jgi:hypothetical protein
MKFKHFIALFFIGAGLVYAQKENYNWTFGQKAGLSWNPSIGETQLPSMEAHNVFELASIGVESEILDEVPQSFSTEMISSEGCFTVSDYAGNLLFYSNGQKIWNKDHQDIADNTILTGHNSSAQSGIVVPFPNQPSKYLAITMGTDLASNAVAELGWAEIQVDPLTREAVNLTTVKNVLTPPQGHIFKEMVTAVRAANKKDFWLIVPSRPDYVLSSNTERYSFYLNVYRIDENGINPEPVVELLETNTYTNSRTSGQIRFSKDGSRFGLVAYRRTSPSGTPPHFHNLVLGNFNSETGEITNLQTAEIGQQTQNFYGIEFDTTGEYVYVTCIQTTDPTSSMFQGKRYILHVYNATDFLNNVPGGKTAIYKLEKDYIAEDDVWNTIPTSTNRPFFGSILRGIDNRLYISEYKTNNLFVITNPSDPQNLKIYRLNSILKNGTIGEIGLPTYASFFFNVEIESLPICVNQPVDFSVHITGGEGAESYAKTEINFGDDSPIHTITSPQLNSTYEFSHLYKNVGPFQIQMNSYDIDDQLINTASKTITKQVSSCQLKVNPHIRIQL